MLMKKTVALLLSVVLAMGCIVIMPSCKSDLTEEPQTPPVTLIEGGVAQYKIVYSATCPDSVFNAVNRMVTGIAAATGVTLATVRDRDVIGMDGRYIIIGECAFEESARIKSTLSNAADSFTFERASSGNLVISASYDDQLVSAVEYYLENLVAKNYNAEAATLVFEGFYYNGSDMLPEGFELDDLEDCRIIYASTPEGYLEMAEKLQGAIRELTGEEIPILKDTERGSRAREILIGRTNRELSDICYEDDAYVMKYDIYAYRGSLQIACGGAFSARKAFERIEKTLLCEDEGFSAPKGSYAAEDLGGEEVPIPQSASVRIMTLNIMPYILGEKIYENVLPVRERAEIFAGVLIKHTPDVVGLQEADSKWEAYIPIYIDVLNEHYDLGYEFVLSSYNGKNNYCSMLYRADKYDALVCKYEPYAYDIAAAEKRGSYIRGASQLVLQNKRHADELFVVVNSHWDHGGDLATADPSRMNNCATAEAEIVNAYKEQYPDARIFCTGDFNNHRFGGVYLSQFCRNIDGTIASEAARDQKTLVATGGYHANDATKMLEDKDRTHSSSNVNFFIDHIVFTSSRASLQTRVVRHDTLYRTENYCHILSDHCPVYADLAFVGK